MSKWWPTILIILGGVVSAVTPTVQGLLSHHPVVTSIIGTILGVIAHWLPSPAQAPAPVQ